MTNPPRYCEAYPRLPVTQLHRAALKHAGRVTWRNSEGLLIGGAEVVGRDTGTVMVEFRIEADGPVEPFGGTMEMQLLFKEAGGLRKDAYARCPACDSSSKLLVAKDQRWACSRCQGLVNRTSLLRPNTRLTEKVEALRKKVGFGRPRGMHQYTYERELGKLRDAEQLLGDRQLTSDAKYTYLVQHYVQLGNGNVRSKEAYSTQLLMEGTQLFTGSLLTFLNQHFNRIAALVYRRSVSFDPPAPIAEVASAIEDAADLAPLTLGLVSPTFPVLSIRGQALTAVDIPFAGDKRLFTVAAQKSISLPPLHGRVDPARGTVRLFRTGDVGDGVSADAILAEQLRVLIEYVRCQWAVVRDYRASLCDNAARYMRQVTHKRRS